MRKGTQISRSHASEPPAAPKQSHREGGSPRLPAPVFHDALHHIKIFQGDCLEILAAIPESCVDLIFADPPYFLSNNGITCHAGRMVSVNKGDWDRLPGPATDPVRVRMDKVHEFNRSWLAACRRVLKPNGTIWVSGTSHVIHSVGFAMQQLGFKLLNDISWVKPNPPPNLSCRYFTHATETIIWAAKDAKSRHAFHYARMKEINSGRQMKSVWEIFPPAKDEKRFGKHPTQKPVALLERILLAASSEGDLVLDPFLGSGTTLVTALRIHRQAIGCELDVASITLAIRRVCSDLVQVRISVSCAHISVDPASRSVDRSNSNAAAMSANATLVRRELVFYFVGNNRREVIYSVAAESMEEALQKFRSSAHAAAPMFFIIKTETEIYLLKS